MIKKTIKGIKYRLDEGNDTPEVIKKRGYKGEIIIPDTIVLKKVSYNVTSIGESAFEGCSSLTAITIPNSVTSIGVHAFNGCSSLTDINYGGTKEQWGEITLDDEWNKKVPAKVINCTDGSVDILPNELQQNPMYRLSMSSLELFHSNFLEWLFDLDHKAFLTCFGFDVDSSTYTIEREYHLGKRDRKQWVTDIAVFKNGKMILIIENKIKSTPSKGQLKYQNELAGEDCKKVLLSLFEYSVIEDKLSKFCKVLYKDLIDKILTNYESHSQFVPYIKDYCKMLQKLQNILDNDPLVTGWKDGHYTAHLSSKKLEIYDMMDAFRKYQAASLVNKFEESIVEKDTSMTCEHSLNNKRACATIAYKLNDRLNVGVQIEHDQLRIFFEDKEKNFNIDNVHKYWGFVVNPREIQGVAKKIEDQQYCSYNMSKSLFIYRYVKLDSKPINIGELCDRVKELLKMISENRNDIVKDILNQGQKN